MHIIQSYTRRVMNIGLWGGFLRHDVHVDVYRALSLAAPSTPLFPNLRKLHWSEWREEFFPFIRLFLGSPLLNTISFAIRGPELAKLSLLPYLANAHPIMSDVDLTTDSNSSPVMVRAVSDMICQWSRLESLKCDWVTDRALAHLARLPALRRLYIGIPRTLETLATVLDDAYLHPSAFSALHDVSLEAQSLAHCTTFVDLIPLCPVESLAIWPSGPGVTRATLWQTFFKSIQNTFSPSLLRKVIFSEDFSTPQGPAQEYILTIDTLRLLFFFPNLIHVQINPIAVVDLDNVALQELSLVWPRLQHLDLGACNGRRGTSRVTLPGLVPLLRNCPHLRYLGIVVDANHIEPDVLANATQGLHVQNTNITSINFGDSEITDVESVAEFISAVLPEVGEIYAWDEDNMRDDEDVADLYGHLWQSVVKILNGASADGSPSEGGEVDG